MAPLRPLPGKRAIPTKSILKRNDDGQVSKSARSDSLFPTTKKDKRRIKHAHLMSKVTKSGSKPKRRRPNKKLVTTLDSLADALPDGDEDAGPDGVAAGSKTEDQVNIIRRKSMKSKPGAMKRRQKLDNSERDRFAKNLAQMAAQGAGSAPTSSVEKLKALRSFISQTLEKRPDMPALRV
ncbi:hypothetical protein H2198_006971 [Neophaeococcomyces mojaviensis]|uniref:Uncharacterized protein n=1 Tax=Neophaeococcomyces mojaviensis TaxID=3383035 RepID=A0ACC3A1H0_9EURO|nr:hypothetical protein H2198_006971 [Knufia sp. JES_112]